MKTETLAIENLTAGRKFTDNMGHTHTATRIENAPGGAGVYVYVTGQGYPEFYVYGTAVTGYVWENTTPAPAAKPFYVLTRKYRANGECIKGRRRFATRAAQQRYIQRAPLDVAITAYN
jgi:hypothetical protein